MPELGVELNVAYAGRLYTQVLRRPQFANKLTWPESIQAADSDLNKSGMTSEYFYAKINKYQLHFPCLPNFGHILRLGYEIYFV